MHRTPARLALALAASLLGAPASSPRRRPAAQTRAADAMLEVQKAAFLALPLATRKAAQDALVWLGFYNGASDGDFGKRTRNSIAAFQKSQKAAGDGVLSAGADPGAPVGSRQGARRRGLPVVDDAKTGARIGAPTRLMAEKNGPKLEFASSADPDLGALYQRLTAETPTRKVAYKAIKPGAFFVVSGQDGAMKFYSRFETNAGATQPIRGFTFSYPATAPISTASRWPPPIRSSLSGRAARRPRPRRATAAPPARPPAAAGAGRDGAPRGARPRADRAEARGVPKPEHRRQARPLRTHRRRDRARLLAGDFGAGASRRGSARSSTISSSSARTEEARGEPAALGGDAEADHRRLAGQERGGGPDLQPRRAACRAGRADRRGASARRRRRPRRLRTRSSARSARTPSSAPASLRPRRRRRSAPARSRSGKRRRWWRCFAKSRPAAARPRCASVSASPTRCRKAPASGPQHDNE